MPIITSVDGEQIFYEIVGDSDISLIPIGGWGTPTGREMWKYQLPFASSYKLVLIDLTGYGRSSKNRKNFTMQSWGYDIKSVVEKLDLNNIILIGQSMGGPIILEAEKLISSRTLGLILVDSLFPNSFYNQVDEEIIKQKLKPFEENFLESWTNLVNSLITDKINPVDVKMFEKTSHQLDQHTIISSQREFLRWEMNDILPEINKPIKCIVAGKTLPEDEEREAYNKLFDTHYIEDSGHIMMFEDPDKFNEILENRIHELLINI